MIGSHGGQFAGEQPLPEFFLLLAGAQRRRAFGGRADLLGIGRCQRQVMRAGFARDVNAAPARIGNLLDAVAAANVDDMQGTAGFPRQVERATDGIQLRCYGS